MRTWMPLGLLLAAAAGAWMMDGVARRKRPSGECGGYWATVVRWTAEWFGVLILMTTLAETFTPGFWQTGWHLQFDRVLRQQWAFPAALALPFVVWGLFLCLALGHANDDRERGRWLAGALGFGTSRKWILLCLIPLAAPLLWFGRERLGLGADGYPAVTWSTLAVLAISLVGVALSEGRAVPAAAQKVAAPQQEPAIVLPPWPKSMQDGGIRLEPVATLSGGDSPSASDTAARDFLDRLRLAGAGSVAATLAETLHRLAEPRMGEESESATLVLAPDDCGQVETLALAAADLALRFGETTLIVSPPSEATALAEDLRRWIRRVAPNGNLEVVTIRPGVGLGHAPSVWVVDAATLSDDFMVRLTSPETASRVGLVVWWSVHLYTGVLAANVWAISRRLHRLIRARGRAGVRILALVRYSFSSDSQMARFVQRLLGLDFENREVHVERHFPKSVNVVRLTGHENFLESAEGRSFPERCRRPELVASLVSARLGWPTYIDPTSEIAGDERTEVLALRAHQRTLKDELAPSPAEAGARIRRLNPGDILSLVEILGQGGRADLAGRTHHVGLVHSGNPYVEYLLGQMAATGQPPQASRRLVGAAGHEGAYRRHMLQALGELEDTRKGLLNTLMWEQGMVNQTLDDIAKAGKLTPHEVQYLDPQTGQRVTEHLYRSLLQNAAAPRPLDTVGENLIDVRDVAAGESRMQVDPERVAIQAYPGRVFFSSGFRYVVGPWQGKPDEWVPCHRQGEPIATWRVRAWKISRMQRGGAESVTDSDGLLMKQLAVTLRYEETTTHVLSRDERSPVGAPATRSRVTIPGAAFPARALLLHFDPVPDPSSIRALAQTLRCLLPVHIGVEEDALEVVPMFGEYLDRQRVYGLAVVDLYPGGIGLVEALDDRDLIRNILVWARDWLSAASGKGNPLGSELALAAGGEEDPAAALVLLTRLVGNGQRERRAIRQR